MNDQIVCLDKDLVGSIRTVARKYSAKLISSLSWNRSFRDEGNRRCKERLGIMGQKKLNEISSGQIYGRANHIFA